MQYTQSDSFNWLHTFLVKFCVLKILIIFIIYTPYILIIKKNQIFILMELLPTYYKAYKDTEQLKNMYLILL